MEELLLLVVSLTTTPCFLSYSNAVFFKKTKPNKEEDIGRTKKNITEYIEGIYDIMTD